MKALSIRQPWAWLIIRPDVVTPSDRQDIIDAGIIKHIENRNWPTQFRGRFLVHAAQGMTRSEYEECEEQCWFVAGRWLHLPKFEDLQRGGIIGSASIVDCVSESESSWFFGRYGFVLRDPQPLPFIPYKGKLGFFDVPDAIVAGGVA